MIALEQAAPCGGQLPPSGPLRQGMAAAASGWTKRPRDIELRTFATIMETGIILCVKMKRSLECTRKECNMLTKSTRAGGSRRLIVSLLVSEQKRTRVKFCG